jgi:hypothetical protein
MSSSGGDARGAAWLTRVLVVPLVVLLLAGGYMVTAKALAVRDAGVTVTETARPSVEQPWNDSYSRRFRGCVPAVLWPGRETPVAVVVQWDGRKVERVERGVALRRALAVNGAEAGRIIGACYR